MRKHTIEDAQKEAEKHNGKCLSQTYVNNSTNLEWECEAKHKWFASYSNVSAGKWCRQCWKDRVCCTLDECVEIARLRGGKCLSTAYVPAPGNMEWECSKQHKWFASFYNVKRGRWCNKCFIDSERVGITKCKELAKQRGWECLSTFYINGKTKLHFICNNGHTVYIDYNSFNQGTGCSACARCKPHTLEFCQGVAKSRGGYCVSTEYVNSNIQMEWECSEKHRWLNSFTKVYNEEQWCRICSIGKSQKRLFELVKSILKTDDVVSEFNGFKWLTERTGKGTQHFDIWVPALKLAVEYNGRQHYEPVPYGGTMENAEREFRQTKRRDRLKYQRVKRHSEDVKFFIRIKYTEELTEDNIRRILIKNGVLSSKTK
jgi:hypothetical protein